MFQQYSLLEMVTRVTIGYGKLGFPSVIGPTQSKKRKSFIVLSDADIKSINAVI
jgi:hypothetical protein